MPNCATIKVLRNVFFPPVKVNPFLSTAIKPGVLIITKCRIQACKKKLTIRENAINEIMGIGFNNAPAANSLSGDIIKIRN